MTLQDLLTRNGTSDHNYRVPLGYHGPPTRERMVFDHDLTIDGPRGLFILDDYVVSAAVSGPAYVLVPRTTCSD